MMTNLEGDSQCITSAHKVQHVISWRKCSIYFENHKIISFVKLGFEMNGIEKKENDENKEVFDRMSFPDSLGFALCYEFFINLLGFTFTCSSAHMHDTTLCVWHCDVCTVLHTVLQTCTVKYLHSKWAAGFSDIGITSALLNQYHESLSHVSVCAVVCSRPKSKSYIYSDVKIQI